MTSKAEYDQYASDAVKRFEEFVQWAISNWPNKEFPLLESDFRASRRELGEILGPKLGDGKDEEEPASPDTKETGQYIDMNPMPWP